MVVVGNFKGGLNLGQGVVANAGGYDGFVVRLDTATGDTRWAAPLGSTGDDDIVAVAIDRKVGGSDDIYVYGEIAIGATLISYDGTGARRWMKSFPSMSLGYEDGLALDQQGPLITGRFYGKLELAGEVLEAEGGWSTDDGDVVLAGFDTAGAPRFARQITDQNRTHTQHLAVAPSGDIYLASDTGIGAHVIDDHIIWKTQQQLRSVPAPPHTSGTSHMVERRRRRNDNYVYDLAIDSTGAVYTLSSCNGKVYTQPEIACDHATGGVIVSYGPDNEYRWSTYIQTAWVEGIATAPDNRLIVAGQTLNNTTDFGGITIAGRGVFVASLATGPAAAPVPLPPAPTITSVQLTGVTDKQIRQGGSATLVISRHRARSCDLGAARNDRRARRRWNGQRA